MINSIQPCHEEHVGELHKSKIDLFCFAIHMEARYEVPYYNRLGYTLNFVMTICVTSYKYKKLSLYW